MRPSQAVPRVVGVSQAPWEDAKGDPYGGEDEGGGEGSNCALSVQYTKEFLA